MFPHVPDQQLWQTSSCTSPELRDDLIISTLFSRLLLNIIITVIIITIIFKSSSFLSASANQASRTRRALNTLSLSAKVTRGRRRLVGSVLSGERSSTSEETFTQATVNVWLDA